MTRYVIWHTPRTGSNVLCDCLVQTGLCGMKALNDAGLFIGFGEGTKQAFEEGAVDAYFARNRTPNGIEGCKLGWDYIEHLNYHLPFGAVDSILGSFDRHMLITREDKVAQAVSRLIARQTGQWTSLDKRLDIEPVYNRERISYFISQAAGHEKAILTWMEIHDVRPFVMTYEENAMSWASAVSWITLELGIEGEVKAIEPVLSRQADPLKAEWIERYNQGE